jgi:hypothetical protein
LSARPRAVEPFGVPFNLTAPGLGTATIPVSIQSKLSIAKVGVNYKF